MLEDSQDFKDTLRAVQDLPKVLTASQLGAAQPRTAILGPQIRLKKKEDMVFSFLVRMGQTRFFQEGEYYARLHEYCGREEMKLPVRRGQGEVCIFPLRPESLKNMSKLPLLVEFWRKGEKDQFAGAVRFDLSRIPKTLQGNEELMKLNVYPLVLHDGPHDIKHINSKKISGNSDLLIAIGTSPQISRLINERKPNHSPPPATEPVSPSRSVVQERSPQRKSGPRVGLLAEAFEAIRDHAGRLEDLISEWISRFGQSKIKEGKLETFLATRTALPNEVLADTFSLFEGTQVRNLQFLASYVSYKQLAQALREKYQSAAAELQVGAASNPQAWQQFLGQPRDQFRVGDVRQLLLSLQVPKESAETYLKLADVQNDGHIKRHLLEKPNRVLPFNLQIAKLMVEERVKDELSCCRAQDYSRLAPPEDEVSAQQLINLFLQLGIRLSYFQTLLFFDRLRALYHEQARSLTVLSSLTLSCWMSPVIKQILEQRGDPAKVALSDLVLFFQQLADHPASETKFEHAASQGFLWKPFQVIYLLREVCRDFDEPRPKDLHLRMFAVAEKQPGSFIGTLFKMYEAAKKLMAQFQNQFNEVVSRFYLEHAESEIAEAMADLSPQFDGLDGPREIFAPLLVFLHENSREQLEAAVGRRTAQMSCRWLVSRVADKYRGVVERELTEAGLAPSAQFVSVADINRRFFQINYFQGLVLIQFLRSREKSKQTLFKSKEESLLTWARECLAAKKERQLQTYLNQQRDRLQPLPTVELLQSQHSAKPAPRGDFRGVKHTFELKVQQLELTRKSHGQLLRVTYSFPQDEHLVVSKAFSTSGHRTSYPVNCSSKHSFILGAEEHILAHLDCPEDGVLFKVVGGQGESTFSESLLSLEELEEAVGKGGLSKVLPLFQSEQARTLVSGKLRVSVGYSSEAALMQKQNQVVKETTLNVYLPKKGFLNVLLEAIIEGPLLEQVQARTVFLSIHPFFEDKRLSRHYQRLSSKQVKGSEGRVVLQDSLGLRLSSELTDYLQNKSGLIQLRTMAEGQPPEQSEVIAKTTLKLFPLINRAEGIKAHFALKRRGGQFACLCKSSLQYDKYRASALRRVDNELSVSRAGEPKLTISFLELVDLRNQLRGLNGEVWFELFAGGRNHVSNSRCRVSDSQLVSLLDSQIELALGAATHLTVVVKYQESQARRTAGHTLGTLSINMKPVLNLMEGSRFAAVASYYVLADEELKPLRARLGVKLLVNLPETKVQTVSSRQDVLLYDQLVSKFKEGLQMTTADFESLEASLLRRGERFPVDLFTRRIYLNLDFLPRVSEDRFQTLERLFLALDEEGSGFLNKHQLQLKIEESPRAFEGVTNDTLTLFVPRELDFFKHDRYVFNGGYQNSFDWVLFLRKVFDLSRRPAGFDRTQTLPQILHSGGERLHYCLEISKVINPPMLPFFVSSPKLPLMSEVFGAGQVDLDFRFMHELQTDSLPPLKLTPIEIFTEVNGQVKYYASSVVDLLALDRVQEKVLPFGNSYLVLRGWLERQPAQLREKEEQQEEQEEEESRGEDDRARLVGEMLRQTLQAGKEDLFQSSWEEDLD